MKIGQYILALDQGTTSSRAILFNAYGAVVASGQREFKQYYPQPGYVEHDPVEILESQLHAIRETFAKAEITAEEIAAIGITNQRRPPSHGTRDRCAHLQRHRLAALPPDGSRMRTADRSRLFRPHLRRDRIGGGRLFFRARK